MSRRVKVNLDQHAASRFSRLFRQLQFTARLLSGQGARQGYLAAADQGLISLANFAATVMIARASTASELGIYGVGFTALRLVRAVQEGITIQPLNALGAPLNEREYQSYATATSLLQVILAAGSAIAALVTGWISLALGNDVAGNLVYALWFPIALWQLQEYIRRMMYTRGQVSQALWNSVLANVVRLGMMALWISRGKMDGITGLQAIAWGSLAALLPGMWQTRQSWTGRLDNLWKTWQINWNFGRWILGGQIANWLSVEAYPVFTAGLISFAAAGAYRALQNLVAPVHLLLRATDTFLTPRAARIFSAQGWPGLQQTIGRIYWVTGVPVLGLLTLAALFPRPLLHFLYGDEYLPFSSALPLMALFYAFWFAYWPLQAGLKAAQASRPIFIANLAAIVAMFTLGLWAISAWGVYGTISGQAANAFIVLVVLAAAWQKKGDR